MIEIYYIIVGFTFLIKMNARLIQIIISSIALLLAMAHVFYPKVQIDEIIITLFVIGVIPWLYHLFKSVELPGGLKISFQDFEKAESRLARAGLVKKRMMSKIRTDIFMRLKQSLAMIQMH